VKLRRQVVEVVDEERLFEEDGGGEVGLRGENG
jgi:hypothetical protein